MPHPTSARDVLTSLTAVDVPSAPRLTWYAGDAERVELSGRVLATWVSKATNLLVELTDAGPGTRVLLDLPPHWRAVVWALATWTAGGCVVLPHEEGADTGERGHPGADVVVTTRPSAYPGHPEVVAVALPALAMAFDADLPPGVTDGAAELMSFGDSPGYLPPLDPSAPALALSSSGDDGVAHDGLLAAASEAAGSDSGARVLLAPTDARAAVLGTLGVLATGGSVVLAEAALGADMQSDIARAERVTAILT